MKKDLRLFQTLLIAGCLIGMIGCAQPGSSGSSGGGAPLGPIGGGSSPSGGGSSSGGNVYTATYRATDSVRVLPSGTDGTAGTSATYVEFGDWPQSKASAGVKFNKEPDSNNYYIGSDGNYYVKIINTYYLIEPIKWRVLTDNYSGKKLLLAENILMSNVPYYEDKDNNRIINGKTVYPNNYEHSQIRAYLNGLSYQGKSGLVSKWSGKGFLQIAFNDVAQNLITVTEVDNTASTTGYSESTCTTQFACENTMDKIFLLSESEVINSVYGFAAYNVSGIDSSKKDKTGRIKKPTAFAKADGAYQSTIEPNGGVWRLRSPKAFKMYDEYVGFHTRSVGPEGDVENPAPAFVDENSGLGIVPAMSISY